MASHISAQVNNERVTVLAIKADTTQIDTLSLIPGSEFIKIYLNGVEKKYSTPDTFFETDDFNAQLIWKKKPYPDSVVISYRVFPYLLSAQYYHKDSEKLKQSDLFNKPYVIETGKQTDYLDVEGLNYSGSFARSITFGNNQDVVVNSSFNLQMSGKLQNDVAIDASITDNNIPIQPDGNTLQLQEFDKVFIKLSKNNHSLIMGDFDIAKPDNYFMNFYKKLQGGSYSGAFNIQDKGILKTGLSLAVAKGIFASQAITVLEGNQGPYKLKGNNGETFIIILAGSERVYIDGELLIRGAENDYIIDYNASEISFTPKRLLTKDKRITIEFEYSDKSYFRSLVYSGSQYTTTDNKLKLRLNIYSEQDGKNQPLDQTLNTTDRQILEQAGDSLNQAYASGIDSIAFDASRIMYKAIDTLGFDSVFIYSTNADSAKFVLSFTELGLNKGNYVQSATLANGRVYKWVAPIAGVAQGTAEPIILLIAPKKTQLLTFGGDFAINATNTVTSEIGISNSDINTFSSIDNADNKGLSYHGGYENITQLSQSLKLISSVQYEFAGKNFVPLERYRPVEFDRDWNVSFSQKTNEHYSIAAFTLAGNKNWDMHLQSSSFIRENYYTGYKQDGATNFKNDNWILSISGSYLQSHADTLYSQFFRPNYAITKIFSATGGWKFGIAYEGEHNHIFISGDSLFTGSFYYNQYKLSISNPDTAVNKIAFDITQRKDKLPKLGHFGDVTNGITYTVSGGLNKNPNSIFSWQASYRTLAILDTSLTTLHSENSLLSRLQHNLIIKKGLFTSDIFYEIGTGQEQKKEYTFVEVEPGQGVYTWQDYNANGIPELNEFEIAAFADEANYIQVYVPTDTYIQTDITQFNYVVALNPKVIWFNKKGFDGFIGKFATQSTLQLNKKVLDDNTFNSFNPFTATEDTSLVSSTVYWQHAIYFNRISPIFGIDYTYQKNFDKQILITGAESRTKSEHRITSRYKIFTPLTCNLVYTNGKKSLLSESFTDKNYFIPYYTIEPKINYVKGSVFRMSIAYAYGASKNIESFEKLTSNSFTFDVRYNVVTKSTISSKISYIRVDYNGFEDSPVGYAMLEGLQNGNNILWELNYDKKLSKILQLTISYQGRKTGETDITHIGKLEMRALF